MALSKVGANGTSFKDVIQLTTSKKRVRQEIEEQRLPRQIVNINTIFTSALPSKPLHISWFAFQADEILSFFLNSEKPANESLLDFIERIRAHRQSLNESSLPEYDREIGSGHISNQSLFFLLECKALIIENRRKQIQYNEAFLKTRGFYTPRLTQSKKKDFKKMLTQNAVLVNAALLQKLWYSLQLSFEETQNLLNYLQYESAKIVLARTYTTEYLDGVMGQDVIQTRDAADINVYNPSMNYVDQLAYIFLGCFSSLKFAKRCLVEELGVQVCDWNQRIMNEADVATDWLENVNDRYYEWFEELSKIACIPAFQLMLAKACMMWDVRPGETEMAFKLNKKIATDDPKRVFGLLRSPLQTQWWMERAIDPGMFIDIRRLKATDRRSISTVAQCLLFDTFLQARHKFEWRKHCCYSETRFRKEYLSVIPHKMPSVVQLRSSWYVHLRHRYYLCHTIERAIYLWVYFMKSRYKFVYQTILQYSELESLKAVWNEWTLKISQPRAVQVVQALPRSNREMFANRHSDGAPDPDRRIIIDEGSIFNTYEEVSIEDALMNDNTNRIQSDVFDDF